MDVERIQKINNLALDLMRQGLAADRESAVEQAEKIFKGQDSEGYSKIRDRMEEVKESKEPEKKEPTEELSQEQIKDILEQNSKFLVKKIKEFQEKISSLEMEMNQLRTQFNYQKLPTVKEVISKKEEPPLGEVQVEKAENSHPRSGNYNDEDVSIEKFFYMGK